MVASYLRVPERLRGYNYHLDSRFVSVKSDDAQIGVPLSLSLKMPLMCLIALCIQAHNLAFLLLRYDPLRRYDRLARSRCSSRSIHRCRFYAEASSFDFLSH